MEHNVNTVPEKWAGMTNKIISSGSLENITLRMSCCCAILDALRWAMDERNEMVDALAGARDLLECIRKDLQADIDSAKEVPA